MMESSGNMKVWQQKIRMKSQASELNMVRCPPIHTLLLLWIVVSVNFFQVLLSFFSELLLIAIDNLS